MAGKAKTTPTSAIADGRSPVARPTIDRDQCRADRRDRSDDTHPRRRQAAIEEGDAEAAAETGERTVHQVGAGR